MEYCFQCEDYPCPRCKADEPYDSFITYRSVKRDFARARQDGLERYIAALGEKALFAGGMEQLRVPVNGTFDDDGSKLTITDAGANRQALYRFIYAE